MARKPLEAHTRAQIILRLDNLGWNVNEKDPKCTVTQEQAKSQAQNALFGGNKPDFVLYEPDGITPIAVIEAKRPGESLDKAMEQCITRYAGPLKTPLAFAFNDTFVVAKHTGQNRPLKIDGEELQDFVDQFVTLRFITEGAEILSAPKGINFTRDELLGIFKSTNNLLRKEGLRDGYERFSAFSEILFLKLIDESEKLHEYRGEPRTFDRKFCWSGFTTAYAKDQDMLDFLNDSVWKRLRSEYGDIFNTSLGIKNADTLREIVDRINPINFTSTDTDVKGDAFEYFLKSVTNGNKDLGEYFTPRHIARTMVHLVKPIYGETIYDPFCGTGGFLLEAFKYLFLRVKADSPDVLKKIKEETLYGGEITSTARIAKMNMILFGDGHSNVKQGDSLAYPIRGQFDIVLSNIPYSQETEHGALYDIPTKNADSLCMQHIWDALVPGGRAAVIVPETFLYEGGVIEKTREMIAKQSEAMSIISLPRGVFMPYTPTKTNIVYFKKGGQFKKVYFFVVYNDGFELNTGRKPKKGTTDLKKLLSEFDDTSVITGQSNIVDRSEIECSNNWNLRPFFYMEDIPEIEGEMVYLDDSIIETSGTLIDPRMEPDNVFSVLQVSQNGIFLSDEIEGSDFTQKYQRVRTGDLAYNPYRINIGSIGVVPSHLDGMLVSPAYVVFRSKSKDFPAAYLLSILKSPRYLRVIMNYSLSSARASLPFSELQRIKIPKPSISDIQILTALEHTIDESSAEVQRAQKGIDTFAERYIREETP